jgi:hypothetical protein
MSIDAGSGTAGTWVAVVRSGVMGRPIDKEGLIARRKVTKRLRRFFGELILNSERDTEFSQKVMERAETFAAAANGRADLQINKD